MNLKKFLIAVLVFSLTGGRVWAAWIRDYGRRIVKAEEYCYFPCREVNRHIGLKNGLIHFKNYIWEENHKTKHEGGFLYDGFIDRIKLSSQRYVLLIPTSLRYSQHLTKGDGVFVAEGEELPGNPGVTLHIDSNERIYFSRWRYSYTPEGLAAMTLQNKSMAELIMPRATYMKLKNV